MKKLLTIIVIIMTIAVVAVSARPGDDFDLKKKVEFQNTIYVIGVADTSLTRSNEAINTEEVACNYLPDTWNSSYFYRENGGVSYAGIVMVDEFRAGVKLADILFFADTIKLKVALNQRLISYIEDNQAGTGNGNILDNVNLYFQYRSYLDMSLQFGNDVVKYTLNPYIQVRMIFDGGAGIESVRIYPYIAHKIVIDKIIEIQQSTEYMMRWYSRMATATNVDSTLSLDLRLGSPGLAGGGAHYLNAFTKRATGYDLGPVSLSWFLRLSVDLDFNNSRWKDTDPGSAVDNVSNAYAASGIGKHWRFRMRYAEVWVNPLKNFKLVALNIGVSDYMDIQPATSSGWAYNNPTTGYFLNELKMGAELVLDKSFVIAAFLKIKTEDYFNAWGVPLNGKLGSGEQWDNNRAAVTTATNTAGTETYQTIPNGNGQLGPNIYVGVSKGAFEWMFGWHGWTNFRDYDLSKMAGFGGDQDFIESKFTLNGQNYYSWRNELESWITWKW